MTLIHFPASSGKQGHLCLDQQAPGGQRSAALLADTRERLKAGKKSSYKSSAVPFLPVLVYGTGSRCQQKASVVVTAVKVRAAIEGARCLPCDVGHMLLV